jgi:hypothetical protein
MWREGGMEGGMERARACETGVGVGEEVGGSENFGSNHSNSIRRIGTTEEVRHQRGSTVVPSQ